MADQPQTIQDLLEGFRSPSPEARPMMRWWWFGPHLRREELLHDLDAMAAAGIGGVEAAFVYPMSGESDRFLSKQFLEDLRFAAESAAQRNLRFDLTLGSGWPFGGPHIDETTAARRIHWEREEVPPGPGRIVLPTVWPGDELIAGYIGNGTRSEEPESFTLLERDGEALLIPDGTGPRVVRIAVSRLTRQSIKRASSGAEGWALDHLSKDAALRHLAEVAEPLVAAAGPERIGTVFCDSLEVYEADWTPGLVEEFTARRGYDPLPQLWQLAFSKDSGRTFRADYYRTLTELLEENFIAVVGDWARSKGLKFRIQSYGQPPATVSSYRYADAFEGEGWGWDIISACRWASSAGQIYGRQVISSETWTWTHSPSFRSTPLDILAEAQDHLLMGINQFIGHGWPNSPRPAAENGLGRVFYAAGALDDRNAWWDAAPALWATLTRLSWLMRQGERLSQVGIYVPARDIYAHFAAAGRADLYKEARLHIGDELPHAVRTAGPDFDLFDDDAVTLLDPARFPVVVLPRATDIPEATRHWLQQVQDAGGTVLDFGGSAGIGTSAETAEEVVEHLQGPVRIRATSAAARNEAVAVTTREIVSGQDAAPGTGLRVHFVANTSSRYVVSELTLQGAQVVERWDPGTGAVVSRHTGQSLKLSLSPYEATILVESGAGTDIDTGAETSVTIGSTETTGAPALALDTWQVQFSDELQPRAVELPHRWEDDPQRAFYSGRARYSTTFEVTEEQEMILDLGPAEHHRLEDPGAAGLMEASFRAEVQPPVGVVARVYLDGEDLGVLWKPPYTLPLGRLSAGRHELVLVVANVTSHQLAADEHLGQMVAEAEASFGRRFGIQTLDLALADVSSGLLSVPQLIRR